MDFEQLDDLLSRGGAGVGAAEAHGMICGISCATEAGVDGNFLAQIFDPPDGSGSDDPESRVMLWELADETVRQLSSDELTFAPFLPSDSAPMGRRTEAMAQWCAGFMAGLGLGGVGDAEELPADTREILADFSELARMAPESEQGESTEAAYVELIEYIRVCVLLVNEELNRPVERGAGATLH